MKKLIYSVIITTIIILILIFIYDNPLISLRLNGSKKIELSYKESYKELGAKSSIFNKPLKVKINSNVINNKVGKYKINYEVNYLFTKKK